MCFAAAVILTGVLGLRLYVVSLQRGDDAAWSALVKYATTSGPQIGTKRVLEPPCTFDENDESDAGYPDVTLGRDVGNQRSASVEGTQAAQVLKREGWRRDPEGTEATETYFSGTRRIADRDVFVAVEFWAPEDSDEAIARLIVRYHFTPRGCSLLSVFGFPFP